MVSPRQKYRDRRKFIWNDFPGTPNKEVAKWQQLGTEHDHFRIVSLNSTVFTDDLKQRRQPIDGSSRNDDYRTGRLSPVITGSTTGCLVEPHGRPLVCNDSAFLSLCRSFPPTLFEARPSSGCSLLPRRALRSRILSLFLFFSDA